jgi:hypothetical protein
MTKGVQWAIVIAGATLIGYLVETSPKLGSWVLVLLVLGLLVEAERKGTFN